MTAHTSKTLALYVQVLGHQVQRAQACQAQAQAQLVRTQGKLQLLQEMTRTAQLKKSAGNVALYANAAGFRSSLTDMAQQFRDTHVVQTLELAQAQQQMQQAMRRHESMSGVLEQVDASVAEAHARQVQKVIDEMATQAWMRQRHRAAGHC